MGVRTIDRPDITSKNTSGQYARQSHRGATSPQLRVQPVEQRGAPGGARWTLGRHCGGLGPFSSHACFWSALRDATCSPHRQHRNGRAPTHHILFPTMFRIEPNDVGWARYIRVRSVSVVDQSQSNVGRKLPVRIGSRGRLKVAIQSIWWAVMSKGKGKGLEGLFDGQHFDRKIIVLCAR